MVCGAQRRKVLSQYELQWLLCAIILNYQSISDFRKQRPSGLKNLFKLFVSFLKDTDFLRCKIIAIDGAKAERIAVRKPIKENLDVEQLLPF
jgi:transposase